MARLNQKGREREREGENGLVWWRGDESTNEARLMTELRFNGQDCRENESLVHDVTGNSSDTTKVKSNFLKAKTLI